MTSGEKIRDARIGRNLTQKELADKLHITPAGIVQWENGIRNPKTSTLLRIADALDMDYRDLVDDKDSARRERMRPMALINQADIDGILQDLALMEQNADAKGNPITSNQRKVWVRERVSQITHEPTKSNIMRQIIAERLKDPSLNEIDAVPQISTREEHQYADQFIQEILEIIRPMNLEGRAAILRHARELAQIPDYQKKKR